MSITIERMLERIELHLRIANSGFLTEEQRTRAAEEGRKMAERNERCGYGPHTNEAGVFWRKDGVASETLFRDETPALLRRIVWLLERADPTAGTPLLTLNEAAEVEAGLERFLKRGAERDLKIPPSAEPAPVERTINLNLDTSPLTEKIEQKIERAVVDTQSLRGEALDQIMERIERLQSLAEGHVRNLADLAGTAKANDRMPGNLSEQVAALLAACPPGTISEATASVQLDDMSATHQVKVRPAADSPIDSETTAAEPSSAEASPAERATWAVAWIRGDGEPDVAMFGEFAERDDLLRTLASLGVRLKLEKFVRP